MTTFSVQGISRNIWVPFKHVVPASTTVDVQGVLEDSYGAFKYEMSIYSAAEDKYKTLEIISRKVGGGTLKRTVYGKIGDSLGVKITFEPVAGSIYLRIENSEVFDVAVEGFYLKLS